MKNTPEILKIKNKKKSNRFEKWKQKPIKSNQVSVFSEKNDLKSRKEIIDYENKSNEIMQKLKK